MHAVDDKPEVRLAGVGAHGVDEVLRPEHLGAPALEIRTEDAEYDVVFRQEEGMQVRGADGSARQRREDGRLACCGAHAEDAVDGLPAHLEIVIVPITGDGVGARVRGGKGAFEVRVQGRLADSGEGSEAGRIQALEEGVVGLEPESSDFRAGVVDRGGGLLQLLGYGHVGFDRHSDVHARGCLAAVVQGYGLEGAHDLFEE